MNPSEHHPAPPLLQTAGSLSSLQEHAKEDTLFYPSRKGESPYPAIEELPVGYKMGYFQNHPLLHSECSRNHTGIQPLQRHALFWQTDWISVPLLFFFLVIAVLLQRNGAQFLQQAKGFFFAPTNAKAQFKVETSLGTYTPAVCTFIASHLLALLTLWHIQPDKQSIVCSTPTLHLLGIFTAIWCLFFIAKHLTYTFVDGIFFYKEKAISWKKYRVFLLCGETLVLFALITPATLSHLSYENVLIFVTLSVIIFRFFYAFKCFQIFFKQKYGGLHLIMYFCALELVPIMVILGILVRTTDYLIVKI